MNTMEKHAPHIALRKFSNGCAAQVSIDTSAPEIAALRRTQAQLRAAAPYPLDRDPLVAVAHRATGNWMPEWGGGLV